jgi:hypothetical protein
MEYYIRTTYAITLCTTRPPTCPAPCTGALGAEQLETAATEEVRLGPCDGWRAPTSWRNRTQDRTCEEGGGVAATPIWNHGRCCEE